MKELLNMMRRRRSKWCMPLVGAVSVAVIIGSIWLNVAPFRSGFEITDELGGLKVLYMFLISSIVLTSTFCWFCEIFSLPVFYVLRQRMLRSLYRWTRCLSETRNHALQ